MKSLEIDLKWCKGCGICVEFCPKGALEIIDGKAALKGGGKCVFCGLCESRCPDYAIYVAEANIAEGREKVG